VRPLERECGGKIFEKCDYLPDKHSGEGAMFFVSYNYKKEDRKKRVANELLRDNSWFEQPLILCVPLKNQKAKMNIRAPARFYELVGIIHIEDEGAESRYFCDLSRTHRDSKYSHIAERRIWTEILSNLKFHLNNNDNCVCVQVQERCLRNSGIESTMSELAT